MTRTISLEHAVVDYTDWGCVTRFHDGTEFGAFPHETPHYRVIAHRLGYRGNLLAYCREHEVAHSIVAQWFQDCPSAVLWALAHGRTPEAVAALHEEILAQTLQRWVRAHERPILGGVDWDGLKSYALGLLNGVDTVHKRTGTAK